MLKLWRSTNQAMSSAVANSALRDTILPLIQKKLGITSDISEIFKEDNIKLGKTVDNKGNVKRLPWEYEKGEKAPAKLFYTIYNGKIPLLNLEIRYKGSKTAEPQFQATATPIFKNMMSGKK